MNGYCMGQGARGKRNTNDTMVTKENCMGEAEKVLDCLTLKKIMFEGATITENQRNLMPIQNIDGCIGSTMQNFYFRWGYTYMQRSVNILSCSSFLEDTLLIRDFNQRP